MFRGQAQRLGCASYMRPVNVAGKAARQNRALVCLAAQTLAQKPQEQQPRVQERKPQNGPKSPFACDLPEPEHLAKPGVVDDNLFSQHWSVNFWRDFRIPESIRNDDLPAAQRVRSVLQALQNGAKEAGVFSSPQSLAYWSYHVPRMGFFALNGLAGAAYSTYMQRSEASNKNDTESTESFDILRALRSGFYMPVSEALLMFYQDYQNIRNGVYKMPWDMTTRNHRQRNPLYVIDKVSRFLTEAAGTLQRRKSHQLETLWLDSNLYPDYYKSTWHFQSDGWMSEQSAAVYETSTETVFIGRQDAMQRQSIIPIAEFMKEKFSKDGYGFQMLDVATGTGRAATFVKDNFPKMGITQLDLSPFYLQKARDNMTYWRKRRGGSNPEESVASKDKFLQAAAENIPVPDESHDIVLSTYLFHEIPELSRQKAAKEMARVCKPGGMVILTDGIQYGDRGSWDASASAFQAFNEPYWGTHVRTNYGKLFGDLGLVPHKKILASGTKILSFRKMPKD